LIINPLKTEEITKAMILVVNDADLRDSLIEKGFRQVSGFTWKSVAEKVLKIYSNIN